MIDHTHNPDALSWVASASEAGNEFPLQNLPFGVFARRGSGDAPRVGVAIGGLILDVAACADAGLITGAAQGPARACAGPSLNALMARGRADWTALRHAIFALLDADAPGADERQDRAAMFLVPCADADMFMPAAVGDYTDFYASVHHAANVGRMMRPDNPLLPNYKHVPIGYHGRASSLVVSGTPVRRPWGQTKPDGADSPLVGPSRRLDYELEVGVFIGPGNDLGSPVPIDAIDDHLFGLCLVNDWSARDMQAWEYQPLGPFLAKNFGTTVSPWVVTMDALEPFRVPPAARPEGDPAPLPYLTGGADRLRGAFDVSLDVFVRSARMREQGLPPHRLSASNLQDLYWTLGQMATHHASNGCNLRPGDLLASGTVSGPGKGARGCLLELTWRGAEPLTLPTGEERRFLEDGDEVALQGTCRRTGAATIGFGECRGIVLPARPSP
ncbi:MAG: fumarylacetoacetase [Vicinamibacterales bacterium]|jgi:fumarylacetoacetase|nr:fumarylacetoacetase [Vicinamibacterales bacterium]